MADINSAILHAIKQALKPLKHRVYGPDVVDDARDAVSKILETALTNNHIVSHSVEETTNVETRAITIDASFSVDPDAPHGDGVNITFTCRH